MKPPKRHSRESALVLLLVAVCTGWLWDRHSYRTNTHVALSAKQPSPQPSPQPNMESIMELSMEPSTQPSTQPSMLLGMESGTQPDSQPSTQPTTQPTSQQSRNGSWASAGLWYPLPQGIPAAAEAAAAVPAPAAPVLPISYGGVRQYRINGAFAQNVKPTPFPPEGTVHFFLRAAASPDGSIRLKGFIFFEYTRRPPTVIPYPQALNVPEVFHTLRVGLRSADNTWNQSLPLSTPVWGCELGLWKRAGPKLKGVYKRCVMHANRTQAPFYRYTDISVDLGVLNTTADIELYVDGWKPYVSLAALLADARAPPPPPFLPWLLPASPSAPRPIIQHITYPKGFPPAVLARLLDWRTAHHVPLGIPATVLYLLPRDEAAVAAHPTIRRLVADDRLRLVRWEGLPLYQGWKDWDMEVQLGHAALSFWNTPALLMMSDLDEFFASRLPLPELFSTPECTSHQPAGCATFYRHNVYLYPTNASGAAPGSAPAATTTAPGVSAKPSAVNTTLLGTPDPAAWNTSGVLPLTLYGASADMRAFVEVPDDQPKTMMDPNRALPSGIHLTTACGGSDPKAPCKDLRPCAVVRQQCAWLVHVKSMFKFRSPRTKRGNKEITMHELGPGWLQLEGQERFW